MKNATIIIALDGGLVQSVITDKEVEVIVIDYDIDGLEEDELTLIPQGDGKMENAYVYQGEVLEVNPGLTNSLKFWATAQGKLENPIPFPNGFRSWKDTFYEVTKEIERMRDWLVMPKRLADIQAEQGRCGFYSLAEELTNKFENINVGRQWDGDFFDELEAFINSELR